MLLSPHFKFLFFHLSEYRVYATSPKVTHTKPFGRRRHTFTEKYFLAIHTNKSNPDRSFFINLIKALNNKHQTNAGLAFEIVFRDDLLNIGRLYVQIVLWLFRKH